MSNWSGSMAKSVELDLRRDLPKVRRRYGSLIKNLGACQYSAPCAVGAMMGAGARRSRAVLANDRRPIRHMVSNGVVHVPPEQLDDFSNLQGAFDGGDIDEFAAILSDLEEKYLGQVPA